jgi:hypothetical protein
MLTILIQTILVASVIYFGFGAVVLLYDTFKEFSK